MGFTYFVNISPNVLCISFLIIAGGESSISIEDMRDFFCCLCSFRTLQSRIQVNISLLLLLLSLLLLLFLSLLLLLPLFFLLNKIEGYLFNLLVLF